ncbi:MAG: hypothetical protein RI894_1901 [Bacteroidota bacterium]|jgi:arabinose-5-phosphate isomerase
MTADNRLIIREAALQTLNVEIAALHALCEAIDADFEQFTQAIFNTTGRLVITGIGKSAIVAQKIVATLNSTGTPALFLHAADAIHGDLGMVQANDLVLCLSKSGDTPEIKVLAPLIKAMGNPLAAMVSNRQSYLAKQADFVLHTPIAHEADPNNLAPTASTTSQMALGDALAVALLTLRGFQAADFARYHPGGALGKQLYLRVCDLTVLHERPMVLPTASISEVISEMTSKRLGATAVITEKGELMGIITDGDLRRMMVNVININSISAYNIMNSTPKTIENSELAIRALELLRKHSISQLIALENSQYKGIVHLHDLVREGLI